VLGVPFGRSSGLAAGVIGAERSLQGGLPVRRGRQPCLGDRLTQRARETRRAQGVSPAPTCHERSVEVARGLRMRRGSRAELNGGQTALITNLARPWQSCAFRRLSAGA